MSESTSRWGADALAVIDLGSNSFRLEIARLRGNDYRSLAYWKEPIRLGAGLDAGGFLTETAIERALTCLRRFGAELQGFSPDRVRAVATQTLREARNRNAFLVRGGEALGHAIEVIAGREEARLIYAGVSHLQPSDETRLVIDIGGRSTEMILGQGLQPLRAESFAIGSVGLSVRCFASGELTESAFREAQVLAAAELEEALVLFGKGRCEPDWSQVLGASGTVGAVAQVVEAAGLSSNGSFGAAELRWCIEACLRAGHVNRLQLPGLKDDRRNVVAGGLCILYTLVSLFGIERIEPAKGALRQGLVFDLGERLKLQQHEDNLDQRDPAVLEVQQRFQVDRAQAGRVRSLALRLHGRLDPSAEPERGLELGWAAAWHELGQSVSHHDHHRHSHYLIQHLDAPGFSQDQLRRMALLALGQRGGLRKLETELRDEALLWQLLALRLALVKCHARSAINEEFMQVQREGRRVRVRMAKGWANAQPQALYLLGEEARAWTKLGLVELQVEA
ncbi:Ppx/GppA phosphatase family protein [Pseudorhodoferax sp.]|uniref:Ppx/GppA phosphatase family protein n=1 Tax=Pseudorhodoferax sp. TaxID=1993553 RepID=UPI002DD6A054|nr:Ppx/GppA phosphatase family protein [Pseudorhodoferax sp.]